MASFLIVEPQPTWKRGAALFGVGIGYGVSPFSLQSLNETLGVPISFQDSAWVNNPHRNHN